MPPVAVKSLTASGQVLAGPGALVALNVTAIGGGSSGRVTLYNNVAASGDIIAMIAVDEDTSESFCPASPIAVSLGIYAVITGSPLVAAVSYY